MKREELVEIKKDKTGTGLLIEHDGYIKANTELIKEGVNGEWHCPYPFIVDAVFQKADVKNANGRIYPRNILEREIERYQEKIREHRALGECNHPSDSTIDLGRISHNIIELHWEGNTVVGKLELNISEGFRRNGICSTFGDTIANLLLNGYKIGVSSRAVGSVEQKLGVLMVGDDLELICWDVVSDPSTPGAWMGQKEELQQYVETKTNKNSIINEKINKIRNVLNS